MAQKMRRLPISRGTKDDFMVQPVNVNGEESSVAAKLFASKYRFDTCHSQDKYDRIILGVNDEWEYYFTEEDRVRLGEYAQNPALKSFVVEWIFNHDDIFSTKTLLFKPTKITERFLENDALITPLFDVYDFACSGYDNVIRIGLLGVDQNGRGIVNMIAVNSRTNTEYGQALMNTWSGGQAEYFSERNVLYASSFLLANRLLREYPEFLSSRKETLTITRQSSKSNKGKKKSTKRNVIKIERTIYELREGAVVSDTTGRIEYTCPCWTVRGHWRHLRDGRKVWVRPYRKGKDRLCDDALVAKDYIA